MWNSLNWVVYISSEKNWRLQFWYLHSKYHLNSGDYEIGDIVGLIFHLKYSILWCHFKMCCFTPSILFHLLRLETFKYRHDLSSLSTGHGIGALYRLRWAQWLNFNITAVAHLCSSNGNYLIMWGIIFSHWVNLKLVLRFHALLIVTIFVPLKLIFKIF